MADGNFPVKDSGGEELLQARLQRVFGLQHGVVAGQRYVHNPRVEDGLVVLSRAASQLLDNADGRTVAAIADALAQDAAHHARLVAAAPILLRNGLVRDGSATWRRPAVKRTSLRRFDLWVHVTNACNLRCPYCYIHKSADHLEPSAAARILDTIEATAASGRYDVIHARYAGGEPMLRLSAMQQFHAEATRRCAAHDTRFSAAILSNGTALPPGAISWLKEQQVSVSISIDGVGDTQDQMRPTVAGNGSYALLQRCLDEYTAAGILPYALVTVGPDNLAGLADLTRMLLHRALPFRYSLVRDLDWGQQGFSDSAILSGPALHRLNDMLTRCYDLVEQDMAERVARSAMPTPSFRSSHRFCDLSPWRPIRKACGAGERFLALGHDGAVSPCQAALHESAKKVEGDDLDALAAAHKPFGRFERTAPNSECQRCRHAPSCAGGCPLLLHRRDGHIDGRSPYCHVFRHVLPRIIKIAALELIGHGRIRKRLENDIDE